MNLKKGEPFDKFGKIIPVHSQDHVMHPVIGHVAYMQDGFFAFVGTGCSRFDSESEAIEFVGRRYNS